MGSIRYIKGIGPKREKVFNRIGIYTMKDFLYYFPIRYEDRTNILPIKDLTENEFCLVRGKVMVTNLRPMKSKAWWGKTSKHSIFEAIIKDESASVNCLWFNQGYLNDYIKTGQDLLAYGKARLYKGTFQISSPEFEVLKSQDDSLNVGRIVGFYRLTRGLSQKIMRKVINSCLDNLVKRINDPIPNHLRKKENLSNIAYSLRNIHFPESLQAANSARQRFIFEELFLSQIMVYLRKAKHRLQKSVVVCCDESLIKKLESNLSFSLTASQKQVIGEIFSDLAKPYPMHRLLQGDVGSGKTVVACFAIAMAAKAGFQVAFMVPTEVLVYQHLETLKAALKGFGLNIGILNSSLPDKEKKKIYLELKNSRLDIVIGTHSLIEQPVEFNNLGLVVIDEQHKFGVAQRALLPKKGKNILPNCLVMSATPIPRSLALSIYGDLDLSVINQMPSGRKQPITMVISEGKRNEIYNFIRERLNESRQVYIVYSVIEESFDWDLRSIKDMYSVIRNEFKDFKVGIFHGKMNSKEKRAVIGEFQNNKINILISTTVIEVGVNIENATVMVVENPERFGLSQLHQLRGRIRRSTYQPYFVLIKNKNIADTAAKRIEVITNTNDGFEIAEEDLKFRGPGDFFGSSQSGFPELKISDPLRDLSILKRARACAYDIIRHDPCLEGAPNRSIKEHIDTLMGNEDYKG